VVCVSTRARILVIQIDSFHLKHTEEMAGACIGTVEHNVLCRPHPDTHLLPCPIDPIPTRAPPPCTSLLLCTIRHQHDSPKKSFAAGFPSASLSLGTLFYPSVVASHMDSSPTTLQLHCFSSPQLAAPPSCNEVGA
jgi:hypothetical protein